ncbi:MAG: MFS transporter [Acidimicrobiales bacterium]
MTTLQPADGADDVEQRSPVPARAWRALAVGSLGFSLMSFNTTATNLAFGDISADFPGASAGALSWVASIFFIGMASLLLVAGRLADRIGRRRMFRAGLVTFAVGSALSAIAPGVEVLIAARLVTAAGGAMILPSSLAVVLPEFPKDRHFSAIAFWSATGPLASALAPGVSAMILAAFSWRVLFVLSAPVAVLALVGSFGSLSESKAASSGGSLDVLGVLVGTAAIALLVFGASFGSEQGWASGVIIGAFLGSAVLLPLFVQRCRTHPQPLLNLQVFTVPAVAVANVANFLLNFAGLATWLVWPLFLGRIWGYSKLETGLALLPGPIISGFVTAGGGRLSERFGHERLVRVGADIATLAVVWPVLTLAEQGSYLRVGPALGLFGMGWSLTHPPLNSGVVNRVSADLYGEVNASFNTVRNIAGALGIAVAVTIIGKEGGAEPLTAYRTVFVVFAVAVALCWAVLALVYPRVSRLQEQVAS